MNLSCKLCEGKLVLDETLFSSHYYYCGSCGKYNESYSKANHSLIEYSFSLENFVLDVYENYSEVYDLIKINDFSISVRGELLGVFDFKIPANITEEKLRKLLVLL